MPAAPLVTTAGTPNGVANSKLIDAASGGSITSTDGRITVSIPAGALPRTKRSLFSPLPIISNSEQVKLTG